MSDDAPKERDLERLASDRDRKIAEIRTRRLRRT
jgi:hypothetical protein